MFVAILFVLALVVLHYAAKRKNIGLFALLLLIIYMIVNHDNKPPKDWK